MVTQEGTGGWDHPQTPDGSSQATNRKRKSGAAEWNPRSYRWPAILTFGGIGLFILAFVIAVFTDFGDGDQFAGEPPKPGIDETVEDRWRDAARDLREYARVLLVDEIKAATGGGTPEDQGRFARLQEAVKLLDQAAQADILAQEARDRAASDNGSPEGGGESGGSDGSSVAVIATLITALAGLLAAVAGVITAIATLIKNRIDARHAAATPSAGGVSRRTLPTLHPDNVS